MHCNALTLSCSMAATGGQSPHFSDAASLPWQGGVPAKLARFAFRQVGQRLLTAPLIMIPGERLRSESTKYASLYPLRKVHACSFQ